METRSSRRQGVQDNSLVVPQFGGKSSNVLNSMSPCLQALGVFLLMLILASCGGRQMSAEEMQRKLDSIQKIEVAERLAAQGINLESSDNPLKQFYDSLELLPLPITYTD